MSILRLANRDLKKINLDDEGSYIEVATDITKREFNQLTEVFPENMSEESGITPKQSVEITAGFFDVFVKGWSLPLPVTREAYLDLPRISGDAIDAALMEHFNNLTVGEPDRKKPRR